MALNKRKVLDAARKHAQKGAKAKALKEYNRLLQADPRDAKLLLEVGDAYRRWGQAEEAISQYGKVAQQYRQDGFDARAVAVFKQILNLDPKHYAAYVSLSELYQRMGLDSEAISALQTAADGYHKEGRKTEALELLRQTAALDPTNTTSRLKVAELLRQEGMEPEALSEYKAVAEELESQQDRDQLIAVQQRILELAPDDASTLSSLVRNLMSTGDFAGAEPFAVRALDASPEPSQYELLMELYAQAGNDAKLADTTRALAKLHRDRGDDDKARDLMQRLPAEDVPSASRLAVDVSEVAEPELGDEELLDEEPFLALSEEAVVSDEVEVEEISLDLGIDDPQAGEAGEVVESDALPEGDPDQLLAEANVYLRYGKRDQAIASLRAILGQEPNHRAALEKLGEAYAEDGENEQAVETWQKAAALVREAGDGEALDVLRDRIAALDPVAAEQVGSIDPAVAESSELTLDLDLEVELDLDQAIDEVAASQTQSGLDLETDDETDDDFEIDIDDGLGLDTEVEAAENQTSGDATETELVDEDEAFEFEFDVDIDDEEDESGEASSVDAMGESSTTAAKVDEELEEAEFYLAQEMYDEAETILARVLEMVPNHPSAMLRMGEIEAARGSASEVDVTEDVQADAVDRVDASATSDLETTERIGEEASVDEDEAFDVEVDLDLDAEELEVDLHVDADTDADATTEGGVDVAGDAESLELDESEEDEEDDTLSATERATEDANAGLEAASPAEDLSGEGQPQATESASEPEEHADGTARDANEESFDLREALADVLTDDDETQDENATSGVLSTVEDGFGSIFSDFKKGVSETLEEGDFETRYDLGIAYREMGLFEDAIGEFRVCLDSPARRFDSLYLMGICARELNRCEDSVAHLEQALALPEIPTERLAGVYFDLSLAQEGVGETARACHSIRKVMELDASFPGAADRLAALESGEPASPALGEPGEGFESFDELFDDDADDAAGDEAMVEAVPAETFESFDDVIEEAESTLQEAAEEAPPAAEPEPDPNEDSKATSKSRRKKISFL